MIEYIPQPNRIFFHFILIILHKSEHEWFATLINYVKINAKTLDNIYREKRTRGVIGESGGCEEDLQIIYDQGIQIGTRGQINAFSYSAEGWKGRWCMCLSVCPWG